jgi:hypothetical protein
MLNSYSNAKFGLNRPDTLKISLNIPTVIAMGILKTFANLQPRCVKCAGDHSTDQCPRKERSSDVRCVLCNGNHPANYKGCKIYKDLQKTYAPLRLKQYTPPAPLQQTLHTQPGITYAQITKPNTCTPTPQATDQLPLNPNSLLVKPTT